MGKTNTTKTLPGDFKVTTPENPLLSQQAVTSKEISVPYTNPQLNPYLNTQLDLFCNDNLSFWCTDPSTWLTNCADPSTRFQSLTRKGCWLQSSSVHPDDDKLSFLLLLLTYSYLSNEIILTLNVYIHHLGWTHILKSNFMNHNQTTSQCLYIQYLSKPHFCG